MLIQWVAINQFNEVQKNHLFHTIQIFLMEFINLKSF